jgi:hypothetical protein
VSEPGVDTPNVSPFSAASFCSNGEFSDTLRSAAASFDNVDPAASEDAAYTEKPAVLQIECVEVVRRCCDKLDLLRHQRLYVRTITASDDEL